LTMRGCGVKRPPRKFRQNKLITSGYLKAWIPGRYSCIYNKTLPYFVGREVLAIFFQMATMDLLTCSIL
jgi:hypothetical protein